MSHWIQSRPSLSNHGPSGEPKMLVSSELDGGVVGGVALFRLEGVALFRLEGVVRWLDAADARLKRLPADGSAMTVVLELRRVPKVYGQGPSEVQALREVDLSVRGGELVAVMGPNGSGKSTLGGDPTPPLRSAEAPVQSWSNWPGSESQPGSRGAFSRSQDTAPLPTVHPNVGIEPAPAGYGQGMATISEPDPRRGSRPPDEAAATESNAPGGIDDELREDQAMRHVTDSLAADYAEAHPAEEIEQVVSEKREHYSDAPVRDFVPILVEREARETLTEPD